MRRTLLLSSLLLLALSASCARKAPGPFECQRFAEQVIGAAHGDPRLTRVAARRMDDLTSQCLTTPYDRQLLQCVESTGRGHACFIAFRQRTGRMLTEF